MHFVTKQGVPGAEGSRSGFPLIRAQALGAGLVSATILNAVGELWMHGVYLSLQFTPSVDSRRHLPLRLGGESCARGYLHVDYLSFPELTPNAPSADGCSTLSTLRAKRVKTGKVKEKCFW
jgi:hypothetical protein